MAKKVRTFFGGDEPTDPTLRPKHLTKQEFGRRLYKLMVQQGWNQSELARQAGLTRDSISTYIRGVSMPEPANAAKLAEAFGIKPEELLPNTIEAAIDADIPSVEIRVSTSDSKVSWLRVNRLVTTDAAQRVLQILNSDALPDRD